MAGKPERHWFPAYEMLGAGGEVGHWWWGGTIVERPTEISV